MSHTPANSRRLVLLLSAGLLGSHAVPYLEIQSFFYAVALVAGGLYVARHASEALWVGFYLLAITEQIYPIQIDELGAAVQGASRPYIFILVVLVGALLIALWTRTGRSYESPGPADSGLRWPIAAFAGVLFLALAHGYFGSMKAPTLVEVIRQCSGWMTLLVFLLLGYRLSTTPDGIQRAFARLRLVGLLYSAFFVAEYIRVWLSGGPGPATEYANSHRDAVFFSGVALAILVAQELAPGIKSVSLKIWFVAATLLLAVLFSGSRAVLGGVVLAALSFVLVWHAKTRLRLGLVAAVAVVAIFVVSSMNLSSLFDPGSLVGSLTSRFLSSPMEDTSFLARGSEMLAVAESVRENPLLGSGPLASYLFLDPLYGWKEATFLDSGLGYLLMKTGLLGTGIFFWFSLRWLKMARGLRRTFPVLMVPLLASFVFYLVYLPFGPSFFEFQHSWLIGLVVGQAIQMASRLPEASAAPVGALCQPGAVA